MESNGRAPVREIMRSRAVSVPCDAIFNIGDDRYVLEKKERIARRKAK